MRREDEFDVSLVPFVIDTAQELLGGLIPARVAAQEFSDLFEDITPAGYTSNFSSFEADLQNHVQTAGTTFTATALLKALSFQDMFGASMSQPVIVLLTDGGVSNGDRPNLPQALAALENTSFHRVSLGLGRQVEDFQDELESISGQGIVVPPVSFDQISSRLTEMVNSVLAACDLGSISGTVVVDGDRSSNVTLGDLPVSTRVQLCLGSTVIAEVMSNSDGTYEFEAVRAATYTIKTPEEVQFFGPGRVIARAGRSVLDQDIGTEGVHTLRVEFLRDCELDDSCTNTISTPDFSFTILGEFSQNAVATNGLFTATDMTPGDFSVILLAPPTGFAYVGAISQNYTSVLGQNSTLQFIYRQLGPHVLIVNVLEDCELTDSCPNDGRTTPEFQVLISIPFTDVLTRDVTTEGSFTRLDTEVNDHEVQIIPPVGIRMLPPSVLPYTSFLGGRTTLNYTYTRIAEDNGRPPCNLNVLFVVDGSESIS